MKTFCRTLVASALALSISGIPLIAQDHHDDRSNRDRSSQRDRDHDQRRDHEQRYVRHTEWGKGSHMSHSDWSRGERIDWHAHHLRQPRRGYEWREVDGNYVMAAVATGVIASVIIASQVH
jgi:Ni/Co efflux regulator RcnB